MHCSATVGSELKERVNPVHRAQSLCFHCVLIQSLILLPNGSKSLPTLIVSIATLEINVKRRVRVNAVNAEFALVRTVATYANAKAVFRTFHKVKVDLDVNGRRILKV